MYIFFFHDNLVQFFSGLLKSGYILVVMDLCMIEEIFYLREFTRVLRSMDLQNLILCLRFCTTIIGFII